jgi:hypothetical protein
LSLGCTTSAPPADGLTAVFSGSSLTELIWDETLRDQTNTTYRVGQVSLVP